MSFLLFISGVGDNCRTSLQEEMLSEEDELGVFAFSSLISSSVFLTLTGLIIMLVSKYRKKKLFFS